MLCMKTRGTGVQLPSPPPINRGIVKWQNRSLISSSPRFDSWSRNQYIMKLFEATIRVNGKEFKDRVGANSAEEARMLLQQRHGPRAVPFIPHMIPH